MKQFHQRVVHVCAKHTALDRRVVQRECRTLAEAGYDVHFIGMPGPESQSPDLYERYGCTFHLLPPQLPVRRRETLAVSTAMGLGPAVLHVHEPSLLLRLAKLRVEVPLIWDVHEHYLLMAAKAAWCPPMLRAALQFLWDRAERQAITRCAAIVPAAASVAVRYLPLHSTVRTVHNYADLRAFSADRRHVCAGQVVYAGSIDEQRGVDDLIVGFSYIASQFPHASLTIVPWQSLERRTALEELVVRASLGGRVQILEPMGEEALRRVFSRSEIAVLPHRDTVAMRGVVPTKLLEYGAMAMPVVWTDLPNHREMVGDVTIGKCVEPGPNGLADGLSTLLSSQEEASRCGQSARRLVEERYSWASEASTLLALYRDLV